MKARLIFLFSVLVFISCFSKKNITPSDQSTDFQSSKAPFTFPDDWLGYWEGELTINNTTGTLQKIPMALDQALTDSSGVYTWAIIYGEDTIKGRRDYLLRTVDATKGHYITDERNGILLDAYLIDNELISVFEVMGNQLITKNKREKDNLIFEILMYKSTVANITGDTIINNDTIPPVSSYIPVVTQKAVLSKRKL